LLLCAEGLATLVLAGILRWRLPGSVLTADFLTSEDKLWLLQQLQPSLAAADSPAADAAAVADAESSAWSSQHQRKARQSPVDPAGGTNGSSSSSSSRTDGVPHTQQQQQQPQGCEEAYVEGSHLQAAPMLAPPLPQQQQQQQQAAQLQAGPAVPLSAVQQLRLTIQNRLIWYLMLLKALKVRWWEGVLALLSGS
jgi:hypothetical protein